MDFTHAVKAAWEKQNSRKAIKTRLKLWSTCRHTQENSYTLFDEINLSFQGFVAPIRYRNVLWLEDN